MSRKNKKQFKSYRDIAKSMGISEWTVWSIMNKIRFRFERYKPFRFLFQNSEMDLEELIFKLKEE